MISRRIAAASKATAALFLAEVTVALAVAGGTVTELAAATGADDDPFRALIGLVERGSHRPPHSLLVALAITAGVGGGYALIEPWLTNVFVRAHARDDEKSSAEPLRRYLALVGARALVVFGLVIALGFFGALLALVHLATRPFADPRAHDLLLLGLGALPVLATPTVLALLDLATVRIAIGQPRPLEAIGDAIRRLDARATLVRALLLGLGLGTVAFEAALAMQLDPLLGYAVATCALFARLLARSVYFAWLTERETRRVD